MQNCLTMPCVEDNAYERKKRERLEEDSENENLKKLEAFRKKNRKSKRLGSSLDEKMNTDMECGEPSRKGKRI